MTWRSEYRQRRAVQRLATASSAAIALLVGGCDQLDWQPREIRDEGELCLLSSPSGQAFSDTAAQTLRGDAPVFVRVVANTCLSSSCDRDRETRCEVEQRGNELTVRSDFDWEKKTGRDVSCTTDCGALVAQCQTPSLPAGVYTVRHGTDTRELVVPGVLAKPCSGARN